VAYGRVIAGAWLAAVAAVAPASLALAESEASEERSPLSIVLFGSLEAGPTKTFAAIGMKKALTGGLAGSGFRLLVKVGGSQEATRAQRPHGTTYKAEAQSMLGYEWRIGDTFLALYGGTDYEGEQREVLAGTLLVNRYGARLHGDLWMTPFKGSMLQASAYISTINGRIWGRVAPAGSCRGIPVWAIPISGRRSRSIASKATASCASACTSPACACSA
jgi:opacity protein-like surface antigen